MTGPSLQVLFLKSDFGCCMEIGLEMAKCGLREMAGATAALLGKK